MRSKGLNVLLITGSRAGMNALECGGIFRPKPRGRGSAQHVDDRIDDGEVSLLLTSPSGTISTAWQVQSVLALSRRYRARSPLILTLAQEGASIAACFPCTRDPFTLGGSIVPFQELLDDIGGIVAPGLAESETELGEVRWGGITLRGGQKRLVVRPGPSLRQQLARGPILQPVTVRRGSPAHG